MKCVGCGVDHKDAFDYCPSCGAPAPQAQPTTLEDEVPGGTVLKNQYKIVAPLARGGMGTVYRGEDISLKRVVAIKVLPTKFNSDPELVERFLREAQAAAALDHPNIVPIYTVGTDQGINFFVMKLIQGETLTKLIRSRALNAGSALHVVTQICDGLDTIHRAGYVHRDIKSSNVMVDSSGRVTLLDFGVLRQAEGSGAGGLTKTGLVMGTPHYIAPEQARDSKLVDHRSDLYALGVVMFEVFAGRLPFIASNVIDVVMKHLTEAPPAPESINPSLPQSISAIVLKALAKKKEDRFQSAMETKAALNHAAQALGYSPQSGTWSSLPGVAATGAVATPVSSVTSTGMGGSLRPQTISNAASAFEATMMPSQLPTGPTAFFGEAQIAARSRRKTAFVVGGVLAAALVGGAIVMATGGSKPEGSRRDPVSASGGAEPGDSNPGLRAREGAIVRAGAGEPGSASPSRGSDPGEARRGTLGPDVPPVVERKKATLFVKEMPAGAKLTINGHETAVPANRTIALEAGKANIVVSMAGFDSRPETIEVIEGLKYERAFSLEKTKPAKPTTGWIKVSAFDDGGSLRPFFKIGGNIYPPGTSRITVKAGSYKVVAELNKYEKVVKSVTVKAGQTSSLPFEMKKK